MEIVPEQAMASMQRIPRVEEIGVRVGEDVEAAIPPAEPPDDPEGEVDAGEHCSQHGVGVGAARRGAQSLRAFRRRSFLSRNQAAPIPLGRSTRRTSRLSENATVCRCPEERRMSTAITAAPLGDHVTRPSSWRNAAVDAPTTSAPRGDKWSSSMKYDSKGTPRAPASCSRTGRRSRTATLR